MAASSAAAEAGAVAGMSVAAATVPGGKLYASDKVYMKTVPQKGRGVFARCAIRAGETIEVCPVVVIPDDQWEIINTTDLTNYYITFGERDCGLHSPLICLSLRVSAPSHCVTLRRHCARLWLAVQPLGAAQLAHGPPLCRARRRVCRAARHRPRRGGHVPLPVGRPVVPHLTPAPTPSLFPLHYLALPLSSSSSDPHSCLLVSVCEKKKAPHAGTRSVSCAHARGPCSLGRGCRARRVHVAVPRAVRARAGTPALAPAAAPAAARAPAAPPPAVPLPARAAAAAAAVAAVRVPAAAAVAAVPRGRRTPARARTRGRGCRDGDLAAETHEHRVEPLLPRGVVLERQRRRRRARQRHLCHRHPVVLCWCACVCVKAQGRVVMKDMGRREGAANPMTRRP